MAQDSIRVAPEQDIIGGAASAIAATTLTLIERNTRVVIATYTADDRQHALKIYRASGSGYDAHICTPNYNELILHMKS
jgi:K+-transporting ATPase c subunit